MVAEGNVDICFFTLSDFSAPLDLNYTASGLPSYGERVVFFGFPHGLHISTKTETGFLAPLARSAYVSGSIEHKAASLLILDGFNNPGYSGSPVYIASSPARLVGVVSSYRYESISHSKIYKIDENGDEYAIPRHFIKPNSGMIYAHYIDDALESLFRLATRNPITWRLLDSL